MLNLLNAMVSCGQKKRTIGSFKTLAQPLHHWSESKDDNVFVLFMYFYFLFHALD